MGTAPSDTGRAVRRWSVWLDRLLAADDLLRQASYRRLFGSVLIGAFGAQFTMLALPLTAAVLLRATPTQMGWLTALEIAPFVLFSLPAGVWLDRVRKLPVYVAGELLLSMSVASVTLAWWLDALAMPLLYAVAFVLGTVQTTSGSAAQIVLTQVVPRERLGGAHAKNALAGSSAEVAGPALAGFVIKLVGAPLALLIDALMLLGSATILRGLRVQEVRPPLPDSHFWRDLKEGVHFVRTHRLLVALAIAVGAWQTSNYAAAAIQFLFATRVLGLSEQAIGLAFVGLGAGTVGASLVGNRLSRRLGPGPSLVLGFALTGAGWLLPSLMPANAWGVAAFVLMLFAFGSGAVIIVINFLALRQSVTPEPLLGRMTSTMRWLILIPAGPGALAAGWLGEHLGLRVALGCAGALALLVAAMAWRDPVLRGLRELPKKPDAGSASSVP